MNRLTQLMTIAGVSLFMWPTAANSSDPEKLEFFEKRIRPVLVEHCYSCHSASAGKSKGGLHLDSRQGLILGGDSGPAMVPGNVDDSLLLAALRHDGLEMPPDQKLPDNVIADFSAWIQSGAVDPRDGEVVRKEHTADPDQGREFWCFQPVHRPTVPESHEPWAVTEIDQLIAGQQQATTDEGQFVAQYAQASPETLIRRLTFVLNGLPPTLQDQADFETAWIQNPEAAMETTIDRLLNSPRFGERWGRHWLDVARFSESTGGGRSLMLPDAWRFRDYVIRAFNSDKPFNQLVREHIAGDLLPYSSDEQHDEQLIGAGYLMLGANNYEEQDKEQLRMDVVDEQIDSTGRSFLGMTLGCCRCHDHKFDPVPTTDYYALAGIFRSTKSLLPSNVSGFVTAPLKIGFDKAAVDAWTAQDSMLARQIMDAKKLLAANRTADAVALTSPQVSVAPAEPESRLKSLEAERAEHRKQKPMMPTAMCVQDEDDPADWHVHIRGEIRNPGPVVRRGFITVATPASSASGAVLPTSTSSSGRLELAEWIISPDNPLTSRVFVNRVWMHVMGQGIVRTPDNFGATGERPTHPELLDYLADTFVNDDNWSVRKLVRRLCLTSTFRRASAASGEWVHRDPENRRLTRGFRRRLDAESLRDSLLQISGTLDLTIQSGRTFEKVSTYDNEFHHDEHTLFCRSVYVPSFRNTMLDMFEVFDVANPNIVCGKRTDSLRPAQSLFMLNSPFVMDQAQRAATTFLMSSEYQPHDPSRNIINAWRICLCRSPSAAELMTAQEVLAEPLDPAAAWGRLFHTLFASVDFRYID